LQTVASGEGERVGETDKGEFVGFDDVEVGGSVGGFVGIRLGDFVGPEVGKKGAGDGDFVGR